jgi:hypothetical protein
MIKKLAGTMHVFGIIFLIAAIILAICAFVAASDENNEAAALAKSLFGNCLFFALLLWILAWLIS